MRSKAVLAGACLPALWLGASPANEPPTLTWLAEDGSPVWQAVLQPAHDPDRGAAVVPLEVGTWYPRLPDIDLDMIEAAGQPPTLRGFAGRVLILDFWASWCEPCAEALPRLEQLYATEHEHGLRVVTVNVKETDDVARQFAWALNLRLPIARYTEPMHEALAIDALPTVIVADRDGRVRARFNGYRPGIEERVATLARDLLVEESSAAVEIAGVLAGEGALEARWSRDVKARVTAVGLLPPADGGVIAATDWDLITLGPRGKVLGKKRVGRGVERLRFDAAARRPETVFGFRPVGRRVTRIPLHGGAASTWQSPANVLDLVVDPASEQRPASLLIGGLDGVRRLAVDGSQITAIEGGGPVWQLARGPDALLALRDGRLAWLDSSLETVREVPVPATARVLVDATGQAEGMGIAPEEVQSATVASVLGGGSQAALATRDRLILIDLDAGHVRFHASWPRIVSVAAGDLDGDGRDELIVGSGTRVTALWAPAGQSRELPP